MNGMIHRFYIYILPPLIQRTKSFVLKIPFDEHAHGSILNCVLEYTIPTLPQGGDPHN